MFKYNYQTMTDAELRQLESTCIERAKTLNGTIRARDWDIQRSTNSAWKRRWREANAQSQELLGQWAEVRREVRKERRARSSR